jgi:hypothetical protein
MPGNRRERRNAAAATAKEIMHLSSPGYHKPPDWPMVVAMAGIALAIYLFVAVRTPAAIVVSLTVAFACLMYIIVHVGTRWAKKAASQIWGRLAIVGIAALVLSVLVGVEGWPPPTARHLRGRNKEAFRFLLNGSPPYSGPSSQAIQIQFLANDYEAGEFAEELVVALFSAGWNVVPRQPQGVLVGRPVRGIEILYRAQHDTEHERLERALKKLVSPDVESFFEPQQGIGIVILVGTCTSCRSD